MKTLLLSASVVALGAVSFAALAREPLSDAEMDRIAAGTSSTVLTSTVDQTAISSSAAACTNCTGTAVGTASGIAVSSGSQAINKAKVNEVLTYPDIKNASGPITVNSTVNQTASSSSTATCTNCTGTGTGTASGIAVSSGSDAANLADVRVVVTGGAIKKATGPITVNSTVNQTADSTSTAACTNCSGTATGTGSGVGVNSGSQALNVANVDLVVAGAAKKQAPGAVTLNSTVNQTAASSSTATCTNCTGTVSAVGVSSGSQALNIATINRIGGGRR